MRSGIITTTILALTAILGSVVLATPGDDARRFPWEGEVSGTNVYVRSGPGTNYYPTTKLNAGDRVVVLAEEFGWYQIVPPPESFSYIDLAGVQREPGSKIGRVVQDSVYVRAGSHLRGRKTSTQVVLNRGAVVEILGETEGFYRIAPPPGATLFMSKDYVQFVPERLGTGLVERHLSSEQPSPVAQAPAPDLRAKSPTAVKPESKTDALAISQPPRPAAAAEEDGPPLKADSTMVSHPDKVAVSPDDPEVSTDLPAEASSATSGRHQTLLTVLESELRTLLQRPMTEQDPGALLPRYEAIASQTEESLPARIARIRIGQLTDLIDMRSQRASILDEVDDLDAFRSRMAAERMKIMRRRVEAAMEEFDLEGELRQSYAFAPEKRRYRLVDPQAQTTIAYVDIPRSVGVDTKQMIGRLVGIRTVSQRLSSSARVPIAVAATVVDLTPRASALGSADTGQVPEATNSLAGNVNTIPQAAPTNGGDLSPQGPAVADGPSLEEDE